MASDLVDQLRASWKLNQRGAGIPEERSPFLRIAADEIERLRKAEADARRETFEEAARIMCFRCESGWLYDRWHGSKEICHTIPEHFHWAGPKRRKCFAYALVARVHAMEKR